jgi:hypothetical protein
MTSRFFLLLSVAFCQPGPRQQCGDMELTRGDWLIPERWLTNDNIDRSLAGVGSYNHRNRSSSLSMSQECIVPRFSLVAIARSSRALSWDLRFLRSVSGIRMSFWVGTVVLCTVSGCSMQAHAVARRIRISWLHEENLRRGSHVELLRLSSSCCRTTSNSNLTRKTADALVRLGTMWGKRSDSGPNRPASPRSRSNDAVHATQHCYHRLT